MNGRNQQTDVNHIVLVGRAGRDPEIRYFESGKVVTTFSMAVNRPMKDAQTDWFDIEIWGKQAEIAGEYVKKGSLIGIEGRIRWDSWTSKDSGDLNIKPLVVAESIRLLGSKRDNSPSPSTSTQQTTTPSFETMQ